MRNLGLIGFGRFGQFIAKYLRSRLHLFVWDLRDQRKKAASLGLTWATLEEAASCQTVVLATPIAEMPTALGQVAPYLRRRALLMDVASVKMLPVKWMLDAAPREVDVIGTHPLFGPSSARSGIKGMPVVLCPARTNHSQRVQDFLTDLGLRVIVTTPEDHDRQMAQSQALCHFVAKGLEKLGLTEQELITPSFEKLMSIVSTLCQDAPELFHDMQVFNPYTGPMRARYLEALKKIESQLAE
ncbi:MAG: prephenate dehydrogenase/arogenate dehydrogenase family protein [Acidobacteriota bacterium]